MTAAGYIVTARHDILPHEYFLAFGVGPEAERSTFGSLRVPLRPWGPSFRTTVKRRSTTRHCGPRRGAEASPHRGSNRSPRYAAFGRRSLPAPFGGAPGGGCS